MVNGCIHAEYPCLADDASLLTAAISNTTATILLSTATNRTFNMIPCYGRRIDFSRYLYSQQQHTRTLNAVTNVLIVLFRCEQHETESIFKVLEMLKNQLDGAQNIAPIARTSTNLLEFSGYTHGQYTSTNHKYVVCTRGWGLGFQVKCETITKHVS